MVAIKPPVSGLIWFRVLGLPDTVVANSRPSGWKASPLKPNPETGVPTSVPVPFVWLMVTSAPKFKPVRPPLAPYMVTLQVGVGLAVGVGVGVGDAVGDGVGVGVKVAVAVAVGVNVAVAVAVGVGEAVAPGVGVGVGGTATMYFESLGMPLVKTVTSA